MSEQQRVTRVFSEDKQPISIKLTRGSKNTYRWDIHIKAGTLDRALELVKCADNWLRQKYLQDQKMKVNLSSDPSKKLVENRG